MPKPTPSSDLATVRAWAWPKWVGFVGWFVEWDDSIPFHYVWTDWDTKHCTRFMWIWRFNDWFVCPFKGGSFYPDMCNQYIHDICERCNWRRDHHDSRPLRRLVRYLEIKMIVWMVLSKQLAEILERGGKPKKE